MKKLLKSEWVIRRESKNRIIIAAYEHLGYLYWTELVLPDLPEDLSSVEDFKGIKFVVGRVDRSPIR